MRCNCIFFAIIIEYMFWGSSAAIMSANIFGKKVSLLISIVLTLIGIGLSIAAIMTPSWQIVNLREYNSIHEHGLWLDCTRHSRGENSYSILRRYATVTEPLHCVYKFDYDKYSGTFDLEDDNSPVGEVNRHKFYGQFFVFSAGMWVVAVDESRSSMIVCCHALMDNRYPATQIIYISPWFQIEMKHKRAPFFRIIILIECYFIT